ADQLDGEGGRWQYEYLDGATVVTDPTGVRYTAHHDENFRTVAIVDDEGHETRWHHDARSNLRGISDPAGGVELFEYDNEGRLVEARDPQGNRSEFAYDADGNLVQTINAVGGISTYEYDDLDRLVRTTTPTGEVAEITYRADGLVDTIRDGRGGTVQHHYDTEGLHTGTTDPLDRTVTFEPRPDGLLAATVDPAGGTTTRTYDHANRLAAVTDANGSTTAWAYDGRGNVVAQTDANGNTTTHTYDRRSLRIATTDPLGRTTTHTYDAAGRPVSSTDPRGVTVTRSYDHLGRIVGIQAPGVDDTVIAYDDANRPRSTTDPAGTVSYDYDRSGRVVAEHHSRGDATVRYRWSPLGGPAAIEMDRAGTLVASTSYRYDAAGRPVEVLDAAGGATSVEYDELGLRARLVHANGTVTSYTHDVAGQLTRISNLPPAYTDLVGETEGPLQNAVDTAAALHALTTELGEAENLEALATLGTGLQTLTTNLLTGGIVTVPALLQLVADLAGVVDDTAGAVDVLADAETIAELERLVDELGQLVHSLPATAGTDPLTDLVEDVTDLAESVTGSVVGLRNELTTLTRLTADAARLVQALLSGGDGAAEVEAVLAEVNTLLAELPEDLTQLGLVVGDTIEVLVDLLGAAGALQSEQVYTYDANGRVSTATRSFVGLGDEILRFPSSYEYDPGGRLVAAWTTDPAAAAFGNATYGYDPAGNRTSVAVAGLVPITASFDAAGQRIADTLGRYTYDAAGNMTSRSLVGATSPATSYDWDAYGRLAGVDDGTISVRNHYDHTGRRTRTEVTDPTGQTSATDSFYAGWDLLFSDGPGIDGVLGDVAYTTLGGTVLNALYGPRLLDVNLTVESGRRLSTALRTHFHTDVTGNVTEVSDSFGNAVVRNAYSPWGETVSLPSELDITGGALLEHGYSGGLGVRATPTGGLLDMRNRTYDPALGQFLSRDPLEQVTGQPYAYASNDPVNLVDPWGLCSIGPVRIGFMSRHDGGCKGAEGARQAASTVGHAAVSIGTGAAVATAIGACGITVVCAAGVGLGGVGIAAAGHAGVDRIAGSPMRQPWEYFAEGALDSAGGVVCGVTFGGGCAAKGGLRPREMLRHPVQESRALLRTLPGNHELGMAAALGVGRTGVREVLFGSGQRGLYASGGAK
ncbi:MAG TPA: hypothetical protein DCS55_10835, partial [Acidimicrobiaceae bacterium]|nr:hypothetical protein [Acidimicrobiaceae bacterium]